ncbi:MAG: hypothetical protein EBR30_15300, partial [Cytophagia bacterium]|nr:hypothetical protein [Cytophagia bacterium]
MQAQQPIVNTKVYIENTGSGYGVTNLCVNVGGTCAYSQTGYILKPSELVFEGNNIGVSTIGMTYSSIVNINNVVLSCSSTPQPYFPFVGPLRCNEISQTNGCGVRLRVVITTLNVGLTHNLPQGSTICGQSLNLTASPSTTFTWEYTTNGTQFSPLSGTGSTNSITYDEVPVGVPVYFRASVGSSCASPLRGPFTFYPPPAPINSVTATRPLCPGGQGSISITHNNVIANTTYVYTLSQYFLSDVACPTSTNALNLGNRILCGAASPPPITTPPNKFYCKGFIGNFQKLFTTGGQQAFTLIPGQTIQEINSNGDIIGNNVLNLLPGVYEIEVETINNLTGSCICRYYIEIPPALPSPINTVSSMSMPSCIGGNDGSVVINIPNLRGKFDPAYDIQYSLLKGGAPYGTSYTNQSANLSPSKTLTLLGLSASDNNQPDYQLLVKDICQSDVMTLTFRVDASIIPLATIPTATNPTCLENNAGNGSIAITMSPNLPNVIYRYSLNGSAAVEGGNTYTFSNLTPANHTLVVTTSNNCAQFETSVLLSSPPAFTVGGVASPINPTCSNSSDGRISLPGLTKSSGTVKYSYELINNVTLQTVSTQNNLTASSYQIPSDLAAGTYRLTVNDQCLNNAVVYTENNITINNPVPISITSVADLAMSCYDEQATRTFTVLNGTPTYWVNVSKNGISLPGYPKINEPRGGSTVLNNLSVDKSNDYTINVAENCSVAGVIDAIDSETFTITSAADFSLVATTSSPLHPNNLNLTCPESNDGRISVLVS